MGHRLAPQVQADIDGIAYYVFVESGNLEVADRLIDSLTARFALLGAYPRAGRRRDDLRPGARAFPVGEYIIVYRIEGADVLIQRVVRGSRDLEALLDEQVALESFKALVESKIVVSTVRFCPSPPTSARDRRRRLSP